MQWIRSHLTSAHLIAMLALFIALGGTTYAATHLPKNSVGARQLKNNAVRSKKVKNHSLLKKDFKKGQIPKGAKGDKGDPGPITGTLPPGVTLKGDWALRVGNNAAGQRMQTAISFGLQLPSAPAPHYIAVGAATPAGCTGNVTNPGADPGNLCVFEQVVTNITAGSQHVFNITDSTPATNTADPWGAGIAATATAAGDSRFRGSWAVTAPAATPGP